MKTIYLTDKLIKRYADHLTEEERAQATIQKYIHDVRVFQNFIENAPITKAALIEWKRQLTERHAPASVNSMLAAVNGLLTFLERRDLTVKPLGIQKTLFLDEKKELSRQDYSRLVKAAEQKENERLCLVMQAICATGIRVSELNFITVDAAKVFPHNLRHLFARTYYSLQKDMTKLADILGHTSINTTRIYTAESGSTHAQQIGQLVWVIT